MECPGTTCAGHRHPSADPLSPDPATTPQPRLLPMGDAAWTLELGTRIDDRTHARVLALADRVEAARQTDPRWANVTDVVPTFRSLTIHVGPLSDDSLGDELLRWATECGDAPAHPGRHWFLPICFDAEFSPDLPRLASVKGLTTAEVIDQLLSAEFQVYLIGFLPGFPYMGGLPPSLSLPRLAKPRLKVPAQSVAVTGEMCAVYPWDSPGGWNLVGRTPVALFDLTQTAAPALLAAGDRVRWHAVDRPEYERLLAGTLSGQVPRAAFRQPPWRPC